MTKASEKHRIRLEGIEVWAPIGYYPEERKTGSEFLVNIDITTDFSGTEYGEDIAETINYEALAEIVKSEMATPAKLIEQTGHRIKKEILRLLPGITSLRVELKKQHPVLALKTASANIIIEYDK